MYNDPNTNNVNSYSGYEVLNITPDSPISAAQFSITQYADSVTMSGLEMLQNSSKEAIIDLFEPIRPIYPLGHINSSADDTISLSYMDDRVWVALPYSKTTQVSYASTCFVFDPSIGKGTWTAIQTADGKAVIAGVDWDDSDGVTHNVAVHPTLPRVLDVNVYWLLN